MNGNRIGRLFEYIAAADPVWGILWAGLAILAVVLGALLWTRWGQSRPLEKCLVLSALVHVWLAVLSMTIKLAIGAPGLDAVETLVTLEEPMTDSDRSTVAVRKAERAEDGLGTPRGPAQFQLDLPRAEPPPEAKPPPVSPTTEPKQPPPEAKPPPMEPKPSAAPAEPPAAATPANATPANATPANATPATPLEAATAGIAVAKDEEADRALQPIRKTVGESDGAWTVSEPPRAPVDEASPDRVWAETGGRAHPSGATGPIPAVYRLRTASDRTQQAQRAGANAESERAVQAALAWMDRQQEPDGRWSAVKHGGGIERMESGLDRQGAGRNADTGVTGLAILAFAAAGNTHREGPHRAVVARGVGYLLHAQASSGALGGNAEVYEFNYCHGMATLAMAELLGMSGDASLREPVARAVRHTLSVQDRHGGGWRYRVGQPGDTSQLGWQLMALKSAALAGVPVADSAWSGIDRFLESVAAGDHGGLASYRPGERVSRTMTAEALVCRVFRGSATDQSAAREAADYVLQQLPHQSEPNLYYWYYATLAMHQMQGEDWRRWSESLQPTLLARQNRQGLTSGSWDPNTQWDGYGGRVYSTALATLCLETYYRFLPLVALQPQTGESLRR